jgi:hypothetical protein
MLAEYVEQCEAVIHFVGKMAGSTPAASSVDDLLRRSPELETRLAEGGLAHDVLKTLTYTQWEAWLAIGFRKSLIIVAPAEGVTLGTSFQPSHASQESQTRHLQRLKDIDRYPILFTSTDNLVASILETAVDALVKAQAPPAAAQRREPFGATIAAIVAGLFVLFIEKMLPLEPWFSELPTLIRVLAVMTVCVFAWFSWRYWETLGGLEELHRSPERLEYDALRDALGTGGTPAKVYRELLTNALDHVDTFFGDAGRNDRSWFARALGLETPGARWTAPAFDRSLLLALLFPALTIYLVWMWSGHVAGAERALGLADLNSDFRRFSLVLALLTTFYSLWRAIKAKRGLLKLRWATLGCAGVIAANIAGASAGNNVTVVAYGAAGSFAFAFAFAVDGSGFFVGSVTGAFAFAVVYFGIFLLGFFGVYAVIEAVSKASSIDFATG